MDAHLLQPLDRIFTAEEIERIFTLRRELSHVPLPLSLRNATNASLRRRPARTG